MRKFFILALALTLTLASLDTITTKCPQKQVLINHVCTQPVFIQGCKRYSSKDKCEICHNEYKLINGATACKLTGGLSFEVKLGCLEIDLNGNCVNCANGFYKSPKGGFCQFGVLNCEVHSPNGECQKCEFDHSLILGQCKHNQLLGCQTQGQNHVCLRCIEPFELVNGNCVINNCKSYYDYGCIDCQCGYYLGRNRKCVPMQNGCIKYSRSVCVGCAKNFRLRGGQCHIQGCLAQGIDPKTGPFCEQCQKGFNKVGSVCEIQNCLELLNDTCMVCKNGYNLRGGVCVQSDKLFVCQD